MSMLIADCPRCHAKNMTFDVEASIYVGKRQGWARTFEAFCICRHCKRSVVWILESDDDDINEIVEKTPPQAIKGTLTPRMKAAAYICIKDIAAHAPPEYLPKDIEAAFREGATCVAVKCWNASGTMFRMSVDLATRPLLPSDEIQGLNSKTRRDLGLRLPWLFDNGILPTDLRELSSCIREDGNDGAHAGTLSEADASDLLDFTHALLHRLFTEPERLRLAKERREKRRESKSE
jgi:Domain of unknown function (DUF4145)